VPGSLVGEPAPRVFPPSEEAVRASDVMRPAIVVHPDDPARQLVDALRDEEVRAVAVVSEHHELLGMVTDEDLLYCLLPPYVLDDEELIGLLEGDADAELRRRLQGKRVKNVVNVRRRRAPPVAPDDSLVEVTRAMVRAGEPSLLVLDGDEVVGVITVDHVLPALLGRSPR
jgi:CBS domain-containing protein